MRTGAQILVDQLMLHGVEHLFCVPGESYLAVLDALHDACIAVTVCRQEGGAAMMADAYGKLTGKPGICFVTRGPGATNASPGVHIAAQDSTPLILFIGQVGRAMREREAFQEVDYRAFYGSMAKWVTEINEPARIPELVSRAFHVATAGRPGPVVIALPEDMLTEAAETADALPFQTSEIYPSPAQVAEIADLVAAAEGPVAVLGGSRWSAAAVTRFAAFADRLDLPVACSFRRQIYPFDHRCYIGDIGVGANPKLVSLVKHADLVLLIGGRFSEMPSQGFSVLEVPVPRQKLIHVYPDPEELGRLYRPYLPVVATPNAFTSMLADVQPAPTAARPQYLAAARSEFLAWNDVERIRSPGDLQMPVVVSELRKRLPADTIVTNGAGNYTVWVHRFWQFRTFGTQIAPTSGSMGYGVPAAVAAKRLFPERMVVAFAGDGCFLMNGQEFATAVQYSLPILVVIVDNGMYGTIRMHQERNYPGRVSATDLRNPDFAAYARAFGGHGERVERNADFTPALERALGSGKPAILHCLVSPEAITPNTTLTALRENAAREQARALSETHA